MRQKAGIKQKRNMKGEQIDMRGDVIREILTMFSCSYSPECLSPLPSCSAPRLRSVLPVLSTQSLQHQKILKRVTKFFSNRFSYFPMKKEIIIAGPK